MRPKEPMGAGQGPLPAPRPGLMKIADFQDPREGSYLGPWWASYSRIPLKWMKGSVSAALGRPNPMVTSTHPQRKVRKG